MIFFLLFYQRLQSHQIMELKLAEKFNATAEGKSSIAPNNGIETRVYLHHQRDVGHLNRTNNGIETRKGLAHHRQTRILIEPIMKLK